MSENRAPETTTTSNAPAESQGQAAPAASWNDGNTSFSNTVPNVAGLQTKENSGISFVDSVPEGYKQKEWVQNIMKSENPTENFFKAHENALSMIGKSGALTAPGEGATEEQIKSWHKAIGVPDDVKGYDYTAPAWSDADKELGQMLEKSRPKGFIEDIKEEARKAGIPPKAFAQLASAYDQKWLAANRELAEQTYKANLELNQDFDQVTTRLFGERKDAVLKQGREYIEKKVPPEMRPILMNSDNNTLAMFAALIDQEHRNNIAEGPSFSTKDGSVGAGPRNLTELQNAMTVEMSKPEFRNFRLPGHDNVVKRVAELRELANELPKR